MRSARPLSSHSAWIFDLDGTLTVAAHDFDAIRAELGLPVGLPILEEIARRPRDEAAELSLRLDAIELEIARTSRPQDGAAELLELLGARGDQLGILTRNSEENARETLAACGLGGFFHDTTIVGRDSSAPKPDPDGAWQLLRRFEAPASRAVLVGDYRFDLEAARAVGALAVYLDVEGSRLWDELADHRFESLGALARALGPGGAP
jgi:HAD superfamily hydrolase (TIGR01509 family)